MATMLKYSKNSASLIWDVPGIENMEWYSGHEHRGHGGDIVPHSTDFPGQILYFNWIHLLLG